MGVDGVTAPVIVVGGGLSGIACARRLHDAGQPVTVLERSHRLGGRMAVRTEHLGGGRHPVDIGAPYFTVRDAGFAEVVEGWRAAGLARVWTDTFALASPDGRMGATSTPERWSTPNGLRSLVEDLAQGLDVCLGTQVRTVDVHDGVPTVDGKPAGAVVLAMPDPQAARLLSPAMASTLGVADRAWSPVIVVWAAWRERWWPAFDAAFVDGSDVLAWVADDGRSRGDDAAVLVAHTTGSLAAARSDDPSSAVAPVLAHLPGVLGAGPMPQPEWARAHRWSLASPHQPHPASFGLSDPLVGVCGDGWGPRSRVEQAWASGDGLGVALLQRLNGAAALV